MNFKWNTKLRYLPCDVTTSVYITHVSYTKIKRDVFSSHFVSAPEWIVRVTHQEIQHYIARDSLILGRDYNSSCGQLRPAAQVEQCKYRNTIIAVVIHLPCSVMSFSFANLWSGAMPIVFSCQDKKYSLKLYNICPNLIRPLMGSENISIK